MTRLVLGQFPVWWWFGRRAGRLAVLPDECSRSDDEKDQHGDGERACGKHRHGVPGGVVQPKGPEGARR